LTTFSLIPIDVARRVLFSFPGWCSLLLIFSYESFSQPSLNRYWIFLKDRPAISALSASELGITDRALRRRAKVLSPDRLIDEQDLLPPTEILEAFRSQGIRIRVISRWLNAVSVEANLRQLEVLHSDARVSSIAPLRFLKKPEPSVSHLPTAPPFQKQSGMTSLDYGISITQVRNMKVVDVHNLGVVGDGVLVGMIDDGFNNHRTHEALKDIRILAEYDFINRDSITYAQPGETDGGGAHGQYTLSALAGFRPGSLIGPAFGATLLLAKTEVGAFEQPIEEDYYVEGLEWLERTGADIISSSLGYIDWYTYDSLDGKTAVTSKAARTLAGKGVLLVTAMGNEGHFRAPNTTGTLIAPADADSIVSIGATFSDGEIVSFSSTGPTFDGRIKPEVVAQGVSVVSASGATNSYESISGTSLSTPLVAGTAALILSAHPHLTPMQVREALMQTATRIEDSPRTASWPNNYYGHGFVNAIDALLYHGIAFSNFPAVELSGSLLTIATFIRSSASLTTDSLALSYQSAPGSAFERVPLTPTSTPYLFQATIPTSVDTNYPRGYFYARDESGRTRFYPSTAPDSLFSFRALINTNIPAFPDLIPKSFSLLPNFPNPFNAETIIVFDAPSSESVQLVIYNLLGQPIRTVYQGNAAIGSNSAHWNGLDDRGVPVPSGTYFYRLHTTSVTLTQKMLLIR
jgi:subtilisin family serine protease